MKSLNEDLKKGQYSQMYLFCGEEYYLKKLYKKRMIKGILPDDDGMNYSYFEGKGINANEIIDLSETMPFFSNHRLLVVENSGFFKKAMPELADALKTLPESTYLIFVEDEIDKRGKMYKAVKEKGRIVEFVTQDEATLVKWIGSQFRNEKKQIDGNTAKYLVEKVGSDMEKLSKEIEKLVCYCLEEQIVTRDDVDAICVNQITNKIFDMTNAVAEKRQKQALEYYYDLIALKEPPMRILFLLTRQFHLLYHVKELSAKGFSNKEIASKAGLHPFVVKKYIDQAKGFRTSTLKAILTEAVDLEESVKTGQLTDTLSVELFIVKYSMS